MNTRRVSALAIIIACLALIFSNLAASNAASASREQARAVATARVTTKAIVRWYDVQGHLIAKRTFHPSDGKFDITKAPSKMGGCEDPICDFSGRAGPAAGGTARVDAVQTGESTLGSRIWSWDVWTKWKWHSTPVCIQKCTVTLLAKGTIGQGSSTWGFDGVLGTDNHYGTACNSRCSYHHSAKAQFSGPNVIGPVHRRPTNTLDSFNDGTFRIRKSCC